MVKKISLFIIINILITALISTAVYFLLLKIIKIEITIILNFLPCVVCGFMAISVTLSSAVMYGKRQEENSFKWIKYTPYEKEFDIVFWTKDSNKYSKVLLSVNAVAVFVLSFNIIMAFVFERLAIVPIGLSSIVISVTYIIHSYLTFREDFNKNDKLKSHKTSDNKLLDNYYHTKLAFIGFVVSVLFVSIILTFLTSKLFALSIIIGSFILLSSIISFIFCFKVDKSVEKRYKIDFK